MRSDDEVEHTGIDRHYLFAALDMSGEGFYVHRSDWPEQASDQSVKQVARQGRRSLLGTQVLRDAGGGIAHVLDVHNPHHDTIFDGTGSATRTSVEVVAILIGETRMRTAPYLKFKARPGLPFLEGWNELYNVI